MRNRKFERKIWRDLTSKQRRSIRNHAQMLMGVPSYECEASWIHIRHLIKRNIKIVNK